MIAFLFNWFVKITGWLPQLLVFRTKVYYEDRAVQGKRIRGRAIVASNHTALMDFAALLFVFGRRTLRCVVAEVMFAKNVFMTLLLRLLGTIKVEREAHDFSFLGRCKKILDRGGVVEIFPEARLPRRGEPRPLSFKPSAVYLALETDTPIIPVYTNGAYFSRERARVIIGKPIDARALLDPTLSEKENIANITQHLRGKIIELEQELKRQAKKETKAAA